MEEIKMFCDRCKDSIPPAWQKEALCYLPWPERLHLCQKCIHTTKDAWIKDWQRVMGING